MAEDSMMTSLAASVIWSEAGTVSSQNDFRPPTGFTLDPETESQERWSIIEKQIRSFADLRDDWDVNQLVHMRLQLMD